MAREWDVRHICFTYIRLVALEDDLIYGNGFSSSSSSCVEVKCCYVKNTRPKNVEMNSQGCYERVYSIDGGHWHRTRRLKLNQHHANKAQCK